MAASTTRASNSGTTVTTPKNNSANTTANTKSEKLSLYGMIAKKAGVPTNGNGEPYITNKTDSDKYFKALNEYNNSNNKAAYLAGVDTSSTGQPRINSAAEAKAYLEAMKKIELASISSSNEQIDTTKTNAPKKISAKEISEKIVDIFPFTQKSYPSDDDIKHPKGACGLFSYAAALSYLTNNTVNPNELDHKNGHNYTALGSSTFIDSKTGITYETDPHYKDDKMTDNKKQVFSEIDNAIQDGQIPIMFHVNNSNEGEHWALITGKNEDGTYQIFEPYNGSVGELTTTMLRYSDTDCTYGYSLISRKEN